MAWKAVTVAVVLAVWVGAARAQEPVRIGVLEDMSGPLSDITGQGSVTAAQFAVADFGGRVLDRPIELLSANHQNKADVASAVARKWYIEDHVGLITGLGNSAAALAVRGVSRDLGRIDIVTSGAVSDLTGKMCSPTGFHWVYDSYALAKTIGGAVVAAGGDTWFFLTADYAFGHAAQRETTGFIEQAHGRVLGSVVLSQGTTDFASYLVQAQASKAKVVGLATAGADTINAIKQASEFGLVAGGQKMAGLVVFINDIHSLGLEAAQGLFLTEAFYWDQNDATRAFAKRFFDVMHKMPNQTQAGTYSAMLAYLKAVKAAQTDEPAVVAEMIHKTPVDDFWVHGARVREDGRLLDPLYLFQVKSPSESRGPWDYYRQIGVVPGEQAFRRIADGGCAYLK